MRFQADHGMVAIVCLFATGAALGVEWRPGYADDFERTKLDGNYDVKNGQAAIVDGRLKLTGNDVTVYCMAPVPRDCRVEFDAMPLPDGMIGSLGCLFWSGGGAHYRFEFGADNNRVNRIIGPGLDLVDNNPSARIEPGKWHRLVAERDGKRLSLTVNGVVVLTGEVEKVVGHEGIQRIALVSDRGMLVDNLRQFSRYPAHPDCCPPPLPWLPLTREGARVVVSRTGRSSPALEDALAALNAGRFDDARQRFEAMDDIVLKLTGLAFVLGHPDYYEKPMYGDLISRQEKPAYSDREVAEYFGEFGAFAARWAAEAARHPDNEILAAYRPLVEHFGRLCLNRWSGPAHAAFIADFDERINPFVHKGSLYRARFIYWNGMEAGDESVKNRARAEMKRLLRLYPGNRILREYVGEPVPWGEELVADTERHPAWAAFLREAYAREIAIVERLCDMRQRSDGQFGGGYGDDVEMLRKVVPIAAISTCSEKVRAGIERLVEGVWANVCRDGYDKDVGDVEHSAENSADAFPTMLLVRYGDPRYYEFNLRSCKTIRDKFMGIDHRGYPRFKSGFFGWEGVATHERAGGDTGYHARAMKHFLWLAWYDNPEARDWYLRWVDGWRATAMLDAPDKPAGVLPGSLWYPSGSYQHPWTGRPWYLEDPVHLYGAWGLPGMLHESFLAAYALSADEKFLRPVQRMLDWATLGPLPRDADHAKTEAGTRDWFRMPMAHTARANHTALYRYLTGERVYDEYTMRFGTPPQLYQIDHNIERYMGDLEKAAKSLRNNLWYYTTETLSTDRLHLPAVESVWGAYTGAITTTGDCELQTFAVTYDTPTADFAALVVDSTPKRLRVWLYSFWDEPTPIHLRVWQLVPGEYVLNCGRRVKGEFPFQNRYAWEEPGRVRVRHRAEPVRVTLPPKTEYVVDLRLDEPIVVPPVACDPALAPRDISVQGRIVSATIHNIGNAAAENVTVALQTLEGETWRTLAVQNVLRLSEPVDLTPFTQTCAFEVVGFDLTRRYRLVVDPEDALYELCETNNIAELAAVRPTPVTLWPEVEAEAASALPQTIELALDGQTRIELVLIPPGEFVMGLPNNEPRAGAYERPPHRVRIDRPFYMGRYEITQKQWKLVMNNNPSHFQGDDNLPVEMVSWEMARDFCERLGRRVRRAVRLPSEAEWEYACRAGTTSYWSFGDDANDLSRYAWYGGRIGEGRTHPVGTKQPNAWGLYDMHGNVREWCADWFDPYPGTRAPAEDFGEPRQRILRGGSWDWMEPENLGSARRDRAVPDARRDHYGLRIVVTP